MDRLPAERELPHLAVAEEGGPSWVFLRGLRRRAPAQLDGHERHKLRQAGGHGRAELGVELLAQRVDLRGLERRHRAGARVAIRACEHARPQFALPTARQQQGRRAQRVQLSSGRPCFGSARSRRQTGRRRRPRDPPLRPAWRAGAGCFHRQRVLRDARQRQALAEARLRALRLVDEDRPEDVDGPRFDERASELPRAVADGLDELDRLVATAACGHRLRGEHGHLRLDGPHPGLPRNLDHPLDPRQRRLGVGVEHVRTQARQPCGRAEPGPAPSRSARSASAERARDASASPDTRCATAATPSATWRRSPPPAGQRSSDASHIVAISRAWREWASTRAAA